MKWGESQPFTEDLAEDPPDPEVCGIGEEQVYLRHQTNEEAEASAALYTVLQTVC